MNTRKIVDIIFKLIGAKFYLDWLLFSNWSSKNPFYKWLYKSLPKENIIDVKTRINFAYVFGVIHLLFLLIDIVCHAFSFSDVVINIYPIIVNLYIGYRCWVVKQNRNFIKKIYGNSY